MTLGYAREEFTLMLGKLICWAYEQGYRLRICDALAKTGHMEGSNHGLGLATDIAVFKPGASEQDMEAHRRMHDAWDALGGAPRIEKDLNHYSLKWEGRW